MAVLLNERLVYQGQDGPCSRRPRGGGVKSNHGACFARVCCFQVGSRGGGAFCIETWDLEMFFELAVLVRALYLSVRFGLLGACGW